jgi:methionyl aminopeptidase
MGSKTPEDHHQGPDGTASRICSILAVTLIPLADSSGHAAIAATNPPKPAAASGLLQSVLEGQDEDGDDDDDDDHHVGADVNPGSQQPTKKKRKRNRRKSKKDPAGQQTAPPRVPLADLFQDRPYPEGQIVELADSNENLQRTTSEEIRHTAAVNDMDDDFLKDYRKAAEIHRQVRQYAQSIAKPGVSMTKLAHEIDDGVRALTGHQGLATGDALKAGLGFPTGLCLNHIGAHWTPNVGSKEIFLQYDDVLKVDFGVHVNGRIVDSAFTVAANPVYDNLLAAVKAATNTGLKVSENPSVKRHGKSDKHTRKPALMPELITSVKRFKK